MASRSAHGSSKQRRRKAWFDAGSAAWRRIAPQFPDCYPCPLCARFFLPAALALDPPALSLEDVPPKSVGGRHLVLTCRECNVRAGHQIDAHAAHQRDAETAVRFEMSDFQIGELIVGGERVNVEFRFGPGGAEVRCLENHNPPGRIERLVERITAEPNWSATLSMHGSAHNQRKADLSRLRSAFLVGFAVLGYSFAFSPALRIVREQLLHTERELFDTRAILLNGQPLDTLRLLRLSAPADLDGAIAVQFGIHLVVLPGDDNDLEFFTRVDRQRRAGGRISFQFEQREWPRQPLFLADVPRLSAPIGVTRV